MALKLQGLLLCVGLQVGAALAAETALNPVTPAMLTEGNANTATWPLYGGNYANWRYSTLTDITRKNVSRLRPAWLFQPGVVGQFEASPTVVDGVMYVTAAYNNLFALNAATGEMLWHYTHKMPNDIQICCGPSNRGVAVTGNMVIMGTLDAHLIAFDRATGKVLWNITIDDYRRGYSVTAAPLVIDDKVIIGPAGGEYGVRGFIDAYAVGTGKRLWRRYTIPAKGEKGAETWAGDSYKTGGGPAWTTGTYDPALRLRYWAVGNPSPDWNGDAREGDNLYADSVLALDPDTGELKWHFQFTPHDVWDFDGNTGMFLVDTLFDGKPVRALAQPNRNGFLYVLDARTGKFLRGTQYTEKLNWATGLDANGRPIPDPKFVPMPNGNPEFICPGTGGGQNGAFTAAYSPQTKMAYVPMMESCAKAEKQTAVFVNNTPFWGGGPGETEGMAGSAYGRLAAVDMTTGKTIWSRRDPWPVMSGTLATAGGVVFSGTQSGQAIALDDTTGEELWHFQTGGIPRGQPITYQLAGVQYVAMPTGGGGILASLFGQNPQMTLGNGLVVFALP